MTVQLWLSEQFSSEFGPEPQTGLRPGSVKSYRDTLKLFLVYIAGACRRPVTRLKLTDLASERVLEFLHMIETERRNRVATRNQRLAALHTFYRYLAVHHTEMLAEAERVEVIPSKRWPASQTIFDVNVIRAWLGHVSLDTTYRYAEISLRTKQAAVATCLPPVDNSDTHLRTSGWHKDQDLMKWLCSL